MGALAVILVLASGVAAAQEPAASPPRTAMQREADALIQAGHAAFDGGRFAGALEHFHQAFALIDDPQILLQVALTLDALRRDVEARETYREYLARVPTSPRRAEIEGRVRAINRAMRAAAAAPSDAPASTPDGTVVRPGLWSWTESAVTDDDDAARVADAPADDVAPEALPPASEGSLAAPPRREPRDRDERWPEWVWIAAGISVGAAVGAVIALIIVASDNDESDVSPSLGAAPLALRF